MSPGYPWSPWTSWFTTQHLGLADLLGPWVRGPGPSSPWPRCPWSTLSFPWLSRILALTLLSHLEPLTHSPSTPGPLPPSAQSHSDLSCSSPSLPVYPFLISITFCSFLPHPHLTWSFRFPSKFSSDPSLRVPCRHWFLLMVSNLSCLPAVGLSIRLGTILIVPALPLPSTGSSVFV